MKYLRQFSTYTIIGFFGAGISFLLMPYLSHFLKPEEYGILSMVNSIVTILIPLIGIAAAGIINVEYYKIKDKSEFASIFSSVQLIPVLPLLFFLLLSFFFAKPIAAFLEIPTDKSYWIPLSCLLAFLTIYYEVLIAYNVTEQKPGFYSLFVISRIAIEVSLTVYFVANLGKGWEGRLMAWLIASIFSFVVAFIYFRKRNLLTTKISRKHTIAAVTFGLPLILHVIGKFVINQSDRVFITKMVSIEEAGIYNIGYQVGMILLIIVGAIANFMQPFLFERLSNLTAIAKAEIIKVTYWVIGAMLLVLLVMTLATPTFFSVLIDQSYAKGTKYVFWVGLSYFFWGVYMLFAGYIYYHGNTRILGLLAVISVILNLCLNYFLINKFGSLGAAYATCISFFVTSVIVVWKANRLFPLPWFQKIKS